MKDFGSAGVLEVVENDADGTYRAVYTVKFHEASCCIASKRRARAG
jgi:phage-related protein